ncbi:hypothetical protein, partial [Cupriavidus sp. 8B]
AGIRKYLKLKIFANPGQPSILSITNLEPRNYPPLWKTVAPLARDGTLADSILGWIKKQADQNRRTRANSDDVARAGTG